MSKMKNEIIESSSYIVWKPIEMFHNEQDKYTTMYDVWCETLIGEAGFRVPCVVYCQGDIWHCTLSGSPIPKNEFKVVAYAVIPTPIYKYGNKCFSYEINRYAPEDELSDYEKDTIH